MEAKELELYYDYIKKAPFEPNAAALDKALECVMTFLQSDSRLSKM